MKRQAGRIDVAEDHLAKLARRLYKTNKADWQGLDVTGIRARLDTLLAALKMPATDLTKLAHEVHALVRDDAPPSDDERRHQMSRMGGPGLTF